MVVLSNSYINIIFYEIIFIMNNMGRFVMIPYNGIMMNVRATPKIIGELTATKKSLLYGFYDSDIARNINDGNMLVIYGRRWVEDKDGKLNKFILPKPKPGALPKIYGDIFLFMFNSNNYMYEDFTKDMWDRISIKK